MFILNFRADKTYILTMFARNLEGAGKDPPNRPSSGIGAKLSMIAALSVPDLLVILGSPLRSQTNLQKLLKDIASIERDPLSVRILQEADAFRLTVQNQWAKNRKQIEYELERMLRIPIPQDYVKVFTTHAEIPVGHALPGLHVICWGHKEEFKNYHSVFLAHELLHFVLPPDQLEVDHALIELVADDELRLRLNGSRRYFQFQGHERLRPLKKRLMPHWQRYLRSKTGNTLTLLADCRKIA